MPNSKSAIKRMRSDARKNEFNQRWLSELKTLSKKLKATEGKPEEAKEISARLVTRLDKAVVKGAIPRGRADRKKSRIARFLASFSKPAAGTAAKKKTSKKTKKKEA